MHTHQLSEGLVFQRLDDLGNMEITLIFGNVYTLTNKNGTENNRQSKKHTEAHTDNEIEGGSVDLSVVVSIQHNGGNEGADRSTGSGNYQTKHVGAVSLGAR